MIGRFVNNGLSRSLRHGQFRLYATFGLLRTLGLWVQRITIQWLVWDMTSSFASLGVVALIEALAVTLILPFAGVWVDRVDRLWMGRWALAYSMIISLSLFAGVAAQWVTLPVLYIFAVLIGVSDGLWSAVRMTIVPRLVPRKDLSGALSVTATYFHSSQFIGPALAGAIIAGFGASWAFLFNAFSCCGLMIFLFFARLMPVEENEASGPSSSTPSAGIKSGSFREMLVALGKDPLLLAMLAIGSTASLFFRPFRELLAGYADTLFAAGSGGLATLASASGVGALIASLVVAIAGSSHPEPRRLVWPFTMGMAALVALGLAQSMSQAVAGAMAISFALTVLGIQAQVIMQQTVPDRLRGRVMSLWGMQMRGLPALGALVMGMAADSLALGSVFLTAAGLALLAGSGLLVMLLKSP